MISFASRRRRRTKYYRYCQYARSAKSLPRAIEPEDVRHLVRLTRVVRDKALILMLLRTGMRVGELLWITVSDLGFLMVLKKKNLEKLVACIRGRVDQAGVR